MALTGLKSATETAKRIPDTILKGFFHIVLPPFFNTESQFAFDDAGKSLPLDRFDIGEMSLRVKE
jgi:hypothetical protein